MSLVGPRPLPLRDHALLEDWHRARYLVLPGMTGLWQISGRSGLDVRRPRAARLHLPRELVDLARHLDHREDHPRGPRGPRRLLRPVAGQGERGQRPYTPPVRAPRILAVASAVDLDFRYGCTPAWWQLWKGMYEAGVDLVVTPYRGRPVESPWWRTAPNPTYREAETYAALRDGLARLKGDRYLRRAEETPDDSALRPAHARDDLARRHPALAAPPRPARRAGATGRGARLHGSDGALPRDPDVPPRALTASRSSSTTATCR